MEDIFNLSSFLLKVVESHYQHRFIVESASGDGPMKTTSYGNRANKT